MSTKKQWKQQLSSWLSNYKQSSSKHAFLGNWEEITSTHTSAHKRRQAAAVNWKSFTQKIALNCTSLGAVDRLLSTLAMSTFGNWPASVTTQECHFCLPRKRWFIALFDILIINSQLICTNASWCDAYLSSFILFICFLALLNLMMILFKVHVQLGKSPLLACY